MPASPRRSMFCAATFALAMAALPAVAAAQDSYPSVEVRQVMGTGRATWASSARVTLDRDAFVVVFELGVDGRARIIHPSSPRDDAFMSAKRDWYVPLPSVDAMFVQTNSLRTPGLVAFASDVAPDLSEFTSSGTRWDYMFSVPEGAAREATLRDLATLLFGDPDMPYSVAESRIAPLIPFAARQALSSCGYNLGAYGSAQFNSFLWDMFGPYHSWGGAGSTITRWQSNNFVNLAALPFGQFGVWSTLGFTRFTSPALWNRFGAGCDGFARLPFMRVALVAPIGDGTGTPVPPDVPVRGPDGTPPEVEIDPSPTTPAAKRAERMRSAIASAEPTTSEPPATSGTLTRETHRELMQRAQVQALIAQLSYERSGGQFGSPPPGGQGGFGRGLTRGGSSGSGFGTITRSGSSGSGGSVGSGGSSSAGSASGSGSAGSSSAGRSSGGRSSSGRSGSGRGNPFE